MRKLVPLTFLLALAACGGTWQEPAPGSSRADATAACEEWAAQQDGSGGAAAFGLLGGLAEKGHIEGTAAYKGCMTRAGYASAN